MSIKISNELLQKYAENTCSPQEKLAVEHWYNVCSAEKSSKIVSESQISAAHDDIWKKINDSIEQPKRFSYTFLKVAAAILITVGVSFGIYQSSRQDSVAQSTSATNFVSGKVKAEIFTTSNRKMVDSNSKVAAILAEFEVGQAVTIRTDIGEEFHANLPDGSEIWLNSNSEIVVHGAYNNRYRDINLQKGEAYFKVAKNKQKPFRVFVDGTKIEALGTEFNVSCYAESKKFKAFLVEGSIRVSKKNELAIIKPNQLYEINNLSGKSSVVEIKNPATQYAWKSGYFEYANTPLPEIIAELSRWYNFKFTIHPGYSGKTLTGKITKKQPFSEVLAILEFSGINYRKEGSTLILEP